MKRNQFLPALEAKNSRASKTQSPMLNFLILYFVLMFIQRIIPLAFAMVKIGEQYISLITGGYTEEYITEQLTQLLNAVSGTSEYLSVTLISEAVLAIGAIIYCVCYEKRSLRSMCIADRAGVPKYFLGLIIGALMAGAAMGFLKVTGAISYIGRPYFSVYNIVMLAIGCTVYGISREIFFRGYFMVSYSTKHSLTGAAVMSALVATVFGTSGETVSLLSLMNVFLLSLALSLLTIRSKSIWLGAALRAAWSFICGFVLVQRIEGAQMYDALLAFSAAKEHSIINGGVLGIEGSLTMTLILLMVFIVYRVTDRSDAQGKEDEDASKS